jgi:hypothetical protein
MTKLRSLKAGTATASAIRNSGPGSANCSTANRMICSPLMMPCAEMGPLKDMPFMALAAVSMDFTIMVLMLADENLVVDERDASENCNIPEELHARLVRKGVIASVRASSTPLVVAST